MSEEKKVPDKIVVTEEEREKVKGLLESTLVLRARAKRALADAEAKGADLDVVLTELAVKYGFDLATHGIDPKTGEVRLSPGR